MARRDLIAGLVAIIFGAWIVYDTFTSFTVQVSSHIGGGIDAGGYPRLLGLLSIGIGVLLVLANLRALAPATRAGTGEPSEGTESFRAAAVAFGVFVAYVALLPHLGYFVATAAVVSVLLWLTGERRPTVIAVWTVAIVATFFIAFRYGATILLPSGSLWRSLGVA